MEPPAHDDWDPSRNHENGAKIYDEITHFIRAKLDKLKENQSYEPLDIPELYKYLPYDEDIDNNSYKRESDSDMTSEKNGAMETFNLIQKQETFNKTVEIMPTEITVLNSPGVKSPILRRNRGTGTGRTNKKRAKSNSNIEGLTAKIFLAAQKGTVLSYRLFLKSTNALKYNISLLAIGEDIEEPISIIDAKDDQNSKILFNNNKIRLLSLDANQEKYINVTIDFPVKLALKVVAHVIH